MIMQQFIPRPAMIMNFPVHIDAKNVDIRVLAAAGLSQQPKQDLLNENLNISRVFRLFWIVVGQGRVRRWTERFAGFSVSFLLMMAATLG
jgi:hypothetical protein